MLKRFYPVMYCNSTYEIDFEKLYREGIRGILFDIDNTLVPHGLAADDRVLTLFKKLKTIGYQICLISNNQLKRVEGFNENLKVHAIHKANKPAKKNYLRAMELMGTTTGDTIFVGDQLFTDIYGANRTNIKSILVKPIDKKEEIQIVLKRYLEKLVLGFYHRKVAKDERRKK